MAPLSVPVPVLGGPGARVGGGGAGSGVLFNDEGTAPQSAVHRTGPENGTLDFNGQPRPGPAMNPLPDIGADEI